MSSVENKDLSVVFNSLQKRLALHLPASSERSWVLSQSTPLLQISFATLKNLPYAFFSKEMGTYDLLHMLSSRVIFLESALMCAVSTAHNLFFAILYTGLTICTLGFSDLINFTCRMHWHQFTYGAVGTSLGAVGVISPYLGAGANVFLLYKTFTMLKGSYQHDVHLFEKPLVNEIQEIFKNYGQIIYNYTEAKINDDTRYQAIYEPTLQHIEERIHKAKRMEDLITLANDIRKDWPKVGHNQVKESWWSRLFRKKTKPRGSKAVHAHYAKSKRIFS